MSYFETTRERLDRTTDALEGVATQLRRGSANEQSMALQLDQGRAIVRKVRDQMLASDHDSTRKVGM